MKLLTILLCLGFAGVVWADTHYIGDNEGSVENIETLVRHGKLKWIYTPQGRRLDIVNPQDALVFNGDMSGPNWRDPAHPQNIFLRDVFLDLKTRYPSRFDFGLGNHEFNRFNFIRDNLRMEQGQHPEYLKWLKDKGLRDSVEERVHYWGVQTYGLNSEGVSLPVADYQKELSARLKRRVSVREAAESFAADLRVGKTGQPHGKTAQLIFAGQEVSYREHYGTTHAPITQGAAGIIPLENAKHDGGISWLMERSEKFFKPHLKKFIADAEAGKVPDELLTSIGDARLDLEADRVTNDANSLSYAERAKEGDQYRGVHPSVAERFAKDQKYPARGLISSHKPAGNVPTVHRQLVDGKPFFDVVIDTSRGPQGGHAAFTVKTDGRMEIYGQLADGRDVSWFVGPDTDPLVGKITDDGFHIKGETPRGEYILEKYSGYKLEQKVVPKKSVDAAHTVFSFENPALNTVLKGKVDALKKAIEKHGGQVLASMDEAHRVAGDRLVINLRGSSTWTAVDDAKAHAIRRDLENLADSLDPHKVVFLTGGNRVSNPNALENIGQEVFGKKGFDIVGFEKHDTPADEVDPFVKYVVMMGEGENWDGPIEAAQEFVSHRRGLTLMVGGGGVLQRSTETSTAAGMKDRLLLVQGYGGASQDMAHKGTPVRGIGEIKHKLAQIGGDIFLPNKRPPARLRVGIYTGSFDPPHVGHKAIVDGMKKRYGLDVVYVIPDQTPVYKPDMKPYADRKRMVELLFEGDTAVRVPSAEMEKLLGAGEMWDAVKAVRVADPDANVHLLMGTDTYHWYAQQDPALRPKDVTVLVNQRGNKKPLAPLPGTKVVAVDLKDDGLFSSTKIRTQLQAGVETPDLPPAVRKYAEEKKLYPHNGPQLTRATVTEAVEKIRGKGKRVVTFVGYSGAEYQDQAKMMREAKKVLAGFDPKKTVINIGGTESGIGAVYKLAKDMGFETTGIVSSLAEEYGGYSPHVGEVMIIKDKTWGGFEGNSSRLNPTSEAMISASDEIVTLGGGPVGAAETRAALARGRKVTILPFEMNHKVALATAIKKNLPRPRDFRGAVHSVFFPDVTSVADIEKYFKGTGKDVVTLVGYSGGEYEDKAKMLSQARRLLERMDPAKTIINIGATQEGIGSVYQLAKSMGFETTGIVSARAKKYGGLSPYVDKAFFVNDKTWGGFDSKGRLNPTSRAMVSVSNRLIGFGGNQVGADELSAAQAMGKPIEFYAADMNHALALKKAKKDNAPLPTDFKGIAHSTMLRQPPTKGSCWERYLRLPGRVRR